MPIKKSKKTSPKPAKSKPAPAAKKVAASKSKAAPKAAKAAPKSGKSVKKALKPVPISKKPAAKPAAKSATKPAAKPAAKIGKPIKASKHDNDVEVPVKPIKNPNSEAFLRRQRERLLILKDSMLDSMTGAARETLRSRAEGSEASAFGMHQADAGSDAYDRDFALSLLSQEQDALYEIEQALKRIDAGTYGICETSNKAIPHPRLEAIPFARHTVECQSQLEKQRKHVRARVAVTSLFGLTDEEAAESDDEERETPSSKNDD